MNAETAEELRRAWAETERARAVLRDVEWAGQEGVYWDGITAACCPSCGGIKPGEDKYESKTPFGHLDTCALVAALLPSGTRSDSPIAAPSGDPPPTPVHVKQRAFTGDPRDPASIGGDDRAKTPSFVENTPKNTDKQMEAFPTDDRAAELFSVERTAAGRIFASASLGGHVGHLIMTEATARKVHRALGIVLSEEP